MDNLKRLLKLELKALLSKIDRLFAITTKKEFVKFCKSEVDNFNDIFLRDYFTNNTNSIDEYFSEVTEKLSKMTGFVSDQSDFLSLKISVFIHCVLPYFVMEKHNYLRLRKIKEFDEIAALFKTMYALISGEIFLYRFRNVISKSFSGYLSKYSDLSNGSKEIIKKIFFQIMDNEFKSLYK
jgi:hypothetical protein